jgi:hypothetical protein
MVDRGEFTGAKDYFAQSIEVYKKWGASGKARRLEEEASDL